MTTTFDAKNIEQYLTSLWLGRPAYFFDSIPSTNDHLKAMAAEDAPAGTMILSDFQSAGKGRLNRRWEAPPGSSLLASLLFRPDWSPKHAIWLTMIAGLAVARGVQKETGLHPVLKWPNDLVLQVGQEWRKFGGLLLEGHFEDGRLDYAILGSGINVNIPEDQLPEAATPATSLSAVLSRAIDRLSLLNSYLMELEVLYAQIEAGWSPWEAWADRLVTLGQPVRVSGQMPEMNIFGTAESVDEWGRLLVRDEAGRLHTLAAGDVSLRG